MEDSMKRHAIACVVAGLIFPVAAYAQTPGSTAQPGTCPKMAGMQKDLGNMMGDVSSMMHSTKDPATSRQLAKMHEQMASMMASMQNMGGMMGGHMMGRGMMGGGAMRTPPSDSPAGAVKPQ
jgi:hypothetical protein